MGPLRRLLAGIRSALGRTAVVVLVVAAIVATGVSYDTPAPIPAPAPPSPSPTVTAPANVAPGDGQPNTQVVAPRALVQKAARTVEADLRDIPDAVAPQTVEGIKQAVEHNRRTTEALPTAGAIQGFKGCVTRILPRNWSPTRRNGVRPVWQQDHYTVSLNRPGWEDVWSVWTFFATTAEASSNFILDSEGHCVYAVPIEGMAWTSAGANPFAISYEVIAMGDGRERNYLAPAGWRKLRSVQRQVAARTRIPLRRGSVSPSNPCVPGRSGIVEHADHGLCGGGHHDIRPFDIDRAVAMVARPPAVPKLERRIAHGVRHPAGTGHSRRFWCSRARARRAVITAAARPPAPPKFGWSRRNRTERQRALARALTTCPKGTTR